MGHLWDIEVSMTVQQGNLIAILGAYPFPVNAENHLCRGVLVGDKTWVCPGVYCPACKCMSRLMRFPVFEPAGAGNGRGATPPSSARAGDGLIIHTIRGVVVNPVRGA